MVRSEPKQAEEREGGEETINIESKASQRGSGV